MAGNQAAYHSATGQNFAISAGCREAVEVAQSIFQQGGNIVDAAVAAVAASCVAMPHMTGIGGELFALVAMKDQPVVAINATGAAPEKATIDAYVRAGHSAIPTVGGLAAQTPCTPYGLEKLNETWGSRRFSELMQPAIELAENGVLIRERLAGMIAARQPALQNMHAWSQVFCPGGIPLPAGTLLRQPKLAEALRTLAELGAAGFADSWVGKDIADSVQADGGFMSQDDIQAAYADVTQPLSYTYKGVEIFTQPPVSQGFIVLRALSLLAMENPGEQTLWTKATNALRQAFAERIAYLRDDTLSRQIAQKLIEQEPEDLSTFHPLTAHPGGDTTALSIIDSQGNAVAIIHSVYDDFGSGLMAEKSGILLNNRLSAFFLNTAYPNALAPRRRSMHTLHTFIAKDSEGVKWAGGSPGADHQPQVNLHVLLHLLDSPQDPARAVSQSRWSVHPGTSPSDILGRSQPYVSFEPGVAQDQLQALGDAGYETRALATRSIGSSKLVGRAPNGLVGAWVDTRRDGAVGAL